MNYRGKSHERIFNGYIDKNSNSSKMLKAIVYLLSADDQLWKRAKKAVSEDKVDFKKIKLSGITISGYTLCKAAQDLYMDTDLLNLRDLSDKYLIPKKLFLIIEDALKIRRYDIKL